MTDRPRQYLEEIAARIHRIATYAQDGAQAFYDSPLLQDAIIHNLELIGEAVKHCPAELINQEPTIAWPLISRMRDRLAHHYLDIDLEIVWSVVGRICRPWLRRLTVY